MPTHACWLNLFDRHATPSRWNIQVDRPLYGPLVKAALLVPRKSGTEVALNLQNHVLAVVGVPKILHSDNGREFVNEIVENVVKEWPGEVTIVNGRPRNPKCQGLV